MFLGGKRSGHRPGTGRNDQEKDQEKGSKKKNRENPSPSSKLELAGRRQIARLESEQRRLDTNRPTGAYLSFDLVCPLVVWSAGQIGFHRSKCCDNTALHRVVARWRRICWSKCW